MATPDRPTTGNLNAALLSEVLAHGRQFDFYQAVRVLLALHPEAALRVAMDSYPKKRCVSAPTPV